MPLSGQPPPLQLTEEHVGSPDIPTAHRRLSGLMKGLMDPFAPKSYTTESQWITGALGLTPAMHRSEDG